MKITNSFDVRLPPERAWPLMLDVERIVGCMPGAEYLGSSGPDSHRGKVSLKLGPLAVTFAGTAILEEKDEAAGRAIVKAKGQEAKGRGGASATAEFTLSAFGPDLSRVTIVTDVSLSGSVAQFGRASGVISAVSQQLVGEFAANLNQMIEKDRAPEAVAKDRAALSVAPAQTNEGAGRPAAKSVSAFRLLVKAVWAGLFSLLPASWRNERSSPP